MTDSPPYGEYKNWEESVLRGVENRIEMEKRVEVARKYFDNWLQIAIDGKLKKEDILYAVLWGSSFVAPRKNEKTDLDIGIILKEGVDLDEKYMASSFFGVSRKEISVTEEEYTGKVDFFIHKPINGGISFIMFPHAAIYRDVSFNKTTLKKFIDGNVEVIMDDIDSALGKGKISQEELKAITRKAIDGLMDVIKK